MKKAMVIMFALALILCVAVVASEKAAPKAVDIHGWVSDEKCAAKGAAAGHEECAKKCIEGGKAVVFVNDADKKVWKVENPEALKGHEGHHVTVNAHVYEDKGSIHIMKVTMMKAAS